MGEPTKKNYLIDDGKADCGRAEDAITVRELMSALSTMPPDARVITEGCDCYGEAGRVGLDEATGLVVIARYDVLR